MKLERDGFDAARDRFFIVSANKRYLGYKRMDDRFAVFYLIFPQTLMLFFMLAASLIFFLRAIGKKPDICYATTPFFVPAFWPCKYFLKIPVFCNLVSSVSDIIGQKGGLKRKIAAKLAWCGEFLGAKTADILMPNSQWLEQKLLGWKIPPNKIVFRPVRPPLIEIDAARAEELGRAHGLSGKRIVFTAARLEKEKNLEIVLRALADIGGNDIVWMIAGAGSQETILKNMAESLGLSGRVIFLGYVDRPDIWHYYYLCSVFLLPSLSEGMPTVILEAMLAGRAVLASDIAGNRQLVKNKESGILFNPLRSDDLADKMISLLDDAFLRERLAEHGEKVALSYIEQYKSIDQVYEIFKARTTAK